MKRLIRFFWVGLKRLLNTQLPLRFPSIGQILACLTILGSVGISYLFGAAVMHYQLPSSDFLDKAFTGAKAFYERGRSQIPNRNRAANKENAGVAVDKPGQTCDGFTLYTTTQGSGATLIDMQGKVAHRWELPFSQAWPQASHIQKPLADEQIHWFRCRAYPNGDLLVIYHADGDTPYGYGLAKLNKDSKPLWTYSNHVHHDLDVGEDGTIYTLTQKLENKPPAGFDSFPTPYIADSLVVLSPDGREQENLPIIEAFRNSLYSVMLALHAEDATPAGLPKGASISPAPGSPALFHLKGDILHANSIKVLSRARAKKFPLFKEGQVLISLRNLNILAVLDTHTRSVVWAARGMWQLQHDAEFLDNGHLLLYDNSGSIRGCRVLEYDPVTQAIPWAYASEDSTPFIALFRGMKQRLPNGNTLIVDPDNGRFLEVTPGKELVWESFCSGIVTSARRYRLDELTFLKKAARPRP